MMIVGGRDCVHGYDWSQWQPPRDHSNDGQDFAVIKVTEGNGFRDPSYRAHLDTLGGKIHGAYCFARPDLTGGNAYQDGRLEARLQLSLMHTSHRFIVLDLEATILDAHQTTQYVRGWLDEVGADGRFPVRDQKVLYVGKFFGWEHAVDVAGRCVLWIPWYTAGYTPNVDPTKIPLPGWAVDLWPEGWAIWQYSSSGTVAGDHPSDVNVATRQWFDAISGGAITQPQPFPTPEITDMAMPIFQTPTGSQYYLADTDDGNGWRHIAGTQRANELALAGKINIADYRNVGVGAGKPGNDPNADVPDRFDATWEAFPVLDGPDARPAIAA